MKNIIYKSFLLFVAASLFQSCKPNLTVPTPGKGDIDGSRYVAVGNSITSGYSDGALYYNGQINSFPNIIAEQLKLVGGGDFKQPLVNSGSVGVGASGNAPFKLGYSNDCLGVNSLGPVSVAASGDMSIFATNIYASQGPFNNMGVPGAKAITVVAPGYGTPGVGNPFFTRMASNPSTASMLSDAMLLDPTFFTLFIGNNDVLAYATAGGSSDAITPTNGPAGVGFSGSIQMIIDSLTKHGAKGVIGNIPDITSLPFFTTIPYNGLALDAATAAQLNAFMPNPLGGSLYNFQEGNNAFIIEDTSVPFLKKRQILPGELLLLDTPLDSIKCHYLGSLKPISAKHVLTLDEISKIQTAVSAYNSIIKSVADAKGLAFVDVNNFMSRTKTGFNYNGITFNAAFVTGGTFSLDGIHLTPIGNALLANEFIKAINATYGSTIPQVDATKYKGIIFP